MRRVLIGLFAGLTCAIGMMCGTAPAQALGTGEALGCTGNSTWSSADCASGNQGTIVYSIHNLAPGSYTFAWTLRSELSDTPSSTCTGSNNCIVSGCTATSTTCTGQFKALASAHTWTGTVVITDAAGHSESLSVRAYIHPCVPNC